MELLKYIKQAAMEATEQSKPTSVMIGTVLNVSPIKIKISEKLILGSEQLVLSRNVTDFDVEMTVDHTTEYWQRIINTRHNHGVASFDSQTSHIHIDSADGETQESTISTSHSHSDEGESYDLEHSHAYKGRKVFRVHNALVAGEKVIIIRENGGQKFFVMDRVGD